MPPKRVPPSSPEGQSSKRAKRATGKTSTNTTKSTRAQAGKPDVSESGEALTASTKALVMKPAGRQAAGSSLSARGRKKANENEPNGTGELGNLQPTPRGKQLQNVKVTGSQVDPYNEATEAKDSSPATPTKTGDNIEVALSESDSKKDTIHAPSSAELHTAATPSLTENAYIQGRATEGVVMARRGNAAAGDTTAATRPRAKAAREASVKVRGAPKLAAKTYTGAATPSTRITSKLQAATTTAEPSTPTNDRGTRKAGLRLASNDKSSSCDSESIDEDNSTDDDDSVDEDGSTDEDGHIDEDDPFGAGVPSKLIQWQRPVPSGILATCTTASTGPWAKPPSTKPTDILPTIEQNSSSPSLQEDDMLYSGMSGGMLEGDANYQHLETSCNQNITAASGTATDQTFLQQGSQPMTVGGDAKSGETGAPFGQTAPVHAARVNPGPVPRTVAAPWNPAELTRNQLPLDVYSSLTKHLNGDDDNGWMAGVGWGIGHGISTLKAIILEEIENMGTAFGRPYPLERGRTRSQQRSMIEANVPFDLLVAKWAGDTFLASLGHSTTPLRHHGPADNRPATVSGHQAPTAYNIPAQHTNPGPAPTMSAGGLAAGRPRDLPPGFSGPWTNQPSNVAGTRNYGTGNETQSADAAHPEFDAAPDGLASQSTGWRGGELSRANPQLATTENGRAVISLGCRQK